MCLHSYLILTGNSQYIPSGFIDSKDGSGAIMPGDWRNADKAANGAFQPIATGRAFNNSSFTANEVRTAFTKYFTFTANEVRTLFTKYFNSPEGSLPWQNNMSQAVLVKCKDNVR